MKTFSFILTLSFALLLVSCMPANEKQTSNDWLTGAPNDTVRFERLQRYLRGFDQPMWEVGERYRSLHDALTRNNFDLASYHWDKIRTAIANGYLKRPARQANADALFLNRVWETVQEALTSQDTDKAWRGFEQAKTACQACHIAESVPFMNDQALFDLAAPGQALESAK